MGTNNVEPHISSFFSSLPPKNVLLLNSQQQHQPTALFQFKTRMKSTQTPKMQLTYGRIERAKKLNVVTRAAIAAYRIYTHTHTRTEYTGRTKTGGFLSSSQTDDLFFIKYAFICRISHRCCRCRFSLVCTRVYMYVFVLKRSYFRLSRSHSFERRFTLLIHCRLHIAYLLCPHESTQCEIRHSCEVSEIMHCLFI